MIKPYRIYSIEHEKYTSDMEPNRYFVLDGLPIEFLPDIETDGPFQYFNPDKWIVERFTGCFDMDKTPIYENDLIEDGDAEKAVVKFESCCFVYEYEKGFQYTCDINNDSIKVIGRK